MNRRTFLVTAALGTCHQSIHGATPGKVFVSSDVAPLRRVLVHAPPGPEVLEKLVPDGNPLPSLPHEGHEQHAAFVGQLRRDGVEVLSLSDLLDEAIERSHRAGYLRRWVEAILPDLEVPLEELSGAHLYAILSGLAEDAPAAIAASAPTALLRCLFFPRDLAVMTPRGLVLTRLINSYRSYEVGLLKFACRWSPALSRYPIAFDATSEGIYLQGGDLMVLDEETLLIGVGNLTEPAAARLLARKLKMNVIAVRLPGTGVFTDDVDIATWSEFRTCFLHLDSVFTLVDERAAITIPYLLESRYADRESTGKLDRALEIFFEEQLGSPRTLRDVGRVQVYKAGSGELQRNSRDAKLLDLLGDRGYRFLHAGGTPPDAVDIPHLVERALPEVFSQASNVVATAPRKVIAFSENPHSIRTLTQAKITTRSVAGSELVPGHGGPHCMTLPLERGGPA